MNQFEAFEVVIKACREVTTNLQGHQTIQEALSVLDQLVNPPVVEEPEPEKKAAKK